MANPFPFSAGDILTAAELNGIGEAFASYTPTVTSSGGTITTVGAVSGRFTVINKIVFGYVEITITTVGTASGQLRFSMPVAKGSNISDQTAIGAGRDREISGLGLQFFTVTTTNLIGVLKQDSASVFGIGNGVGIRGSFCYETN